MKKHFTFPDVNIPCSHTRWYDISSDTHVCMHVVRFEIEINKLYNIFINEVAFCISCCQHTLCQHELIWFIEWYACVYARRQIWNRNQLFTYFIYKWSSILHFLMSTYFVPTRFDIIYRVICMCVCMSSDLK